MRRKNKKFVTIEQFTHSFFLAFQADFEMGARADISVVLDGVDITEQANMHPPGDLYLDPELWMEKATQWLSSKENRKIVTKGCETYRDICGLELRERDGRDYLMWKLG